MNETEFKIAVEGLLDMKLNQDITFTPTGGKDAVIARHVDWVKRASAQGVWDEQIADNRYHELKDQLDV